MGCPWNDDYYLKPADKGSTTNPDASGAAAVSSSGSSGTLSAGGAVSAGGAMSAGVPASAGAPEEAGGAAGAGMGGCASATRDGHDYAFCFSALDQAQARTHCVELGMTLAIVEDAAENAWIAATLGELYRGSASYAFLGANDVETEGEWRRADGVTFWRGGANGAPVFGNYANWGPGQPSDPGTTTAAAEDCLTLSVADGTWNDASCDSVLPYVCESR